MITDIYNIPSELLIDYEGNKKRRNVFIITKYENRCLVCYYDDVYECARTQWLDVKQIEEKGRIIREEIQQDLAYLMIEDKKRLYNFNIGDIVRVGKNIYLIIYQRDDETNVLTLDKSGFKTISLPCDLRVDGWFENELYALFTRLS